MRRPLTFLFLVFSLVSVALAFLIGPLQAQVSLRPPGEGSVRALVVGIDEYAAKRWLKGAAADARDLEASLRRLGVTDLTVLINNNATRAAIEKSIERLIGNSSSNDLVIIAFAGHGARLPELIKNSKPDHMDEVYVLARFDEKIKKGHNERIHGPEIKSWLSKLDKKGVTVLFIADTCHGGGLTRTADPREKSLSYRFIDINAHLLEDNPPTEATLANATSDESSFSRVTFLAAADPYTRAPEVRIGGKMRGALSYSVARALEGAADGARKGAVTRGDLIKYVEQAVYQFTQSKQRIYYQPTRAAALDAVVFRSTAPAVVTRPVRVFAPTSLRVKVIGADPSTIAAVRPGVTSFAAVGRDEDADLIWDASRNEAIFAGDVIARKVTAQDLPGVADRITAVRTIALLSQSRPLPFKLQPNDRVHRPGEKDLRLVANDLRNKHLIVFNIAGDGTIQYLFPLSHDRSLVKDAVWSLPIDEIKEPFGFDQVVAIASDTRLTGLEAALRRHDGTRAAGQLPLILEEYIGAKPKVLIGLAGIVTAP